MLAPGLLQAPISWMEHGVEPDQKEESKVCPVHSMNTTGWPRSIPDGAWGASFSGAPETSAGLPFSSLLRFEPSHAGARRHRLRTAMCQVPC